MMTTLLCIFYQKSSSHYLQQHATYLKIDIHFCREKNVHRTHKTKNHNVAYQKTWKLSILWRLHQGTYIIGSILVHYQNWINLNQKWGMIFFPILILDVYFSIALFYAFSSIFWWSVVLLLLLPYWHVIYKRYRKLRPRPTNCSYDAHNVTLYPTDQAPNGP